MDINIAIKQIKYKNKNNLKFLKQHKDVFNSLQNKQLTKTNICKMKGTNLYKTRINDKYRVLFLLKKEIMYIFFTGNRDHIYQNKFERKYKINEYKWNNY